MIVVPSANEAATASTRYSSIIEGARSGGTSTPRSFDARTRNCAIGSPASPRTSLSSIEAPISRSVVNRPVRSGLVMTSENTTSEPSTISAATIGNAADDGSAGTTTSAPCSSGWPVSAILRPWLPSLVETISRAEMLQHQFGVVAAGFLLDHGGDAGRGEPRQQHRRLDLGGGHRGPVQDRHADRGRRAASAAGGRLPWPRRSWRPSVPGDRGSAASGGSAARRRRRKPPLSGSRPPPPSPAGSRCRNCRNRAGRPAGRSRPRRRPATDQANGPVRSTLAPSACIDLAVLRTSSPSSRPEIRGFADRKRPQDEGAVRNRLVAGNADFAGQGAAGAGFQRGRGGLNGSRLCPLRRAAVSHGPHGVTRPSNASNRY